MQVETSVGFIGYCSHLVKNISMKVADKPGQAHPNVWEKPPVLHPDSPTAMQLKGRSTSPESQAALKINVYQL